MKQDGRSLQIVDAIDRLLGAFERAFLWAACACIAVMLAINVANLLSRNILDEGIIWVWPWTGTLLIWSVFLSFFVLYRRKLDIRVEYFSDRMSPKHRRIAQIVSNSCGLLMMVIIVIEAPQIFARQVGNMEFVGLERYVLSIPLIAAAFLIMLDLALDIARILLTPIVPPASTEVELPRWSL